MHAGQSLVEQPGWRDAVGDAGVPDLPLGPREPLRHRRLGDEERPGDLDGRQAAERAQRQGDPSVRREGRMAAREEQAEAVVGQVHHLLVAPETSEGIELSRDLQLLPSESLPAQTIDRTVAGGGGDPGTRVVRHPLACPAIEGDDERVLYGLLRQVEVPGHADEGRDRTPRLVAERAIDDRVRVGGDGDRTILSRRP